uniref:Uncharacterized protein n=1 Tax=Arundo donax TaxID=35708 RepID=A0A0A9GH19_ARUDO
MLELLDEEESPTPRIREDVNLALEFAFVMLWLLFQQESWIIELLKLTYVLLG